MSISARILTWLFFVCVCVSHALCSTSVGGREGRVFLFFLCSFVGEDNFSFGLQKTGKNWSKFVVLLKPCKSMPSFVTPDFCGL